MSSSTKNVTVFPKMNKVKRGVVSACPNWLDMAPLYVFSLWIPTFSETWEEFLGERGIFY